MKHLPLTLKKITTWYKGWKPWRLVRWVLLSLALPWLIYLAFLVAAILNPIPGKDLAGFPESRRIRDSSGSLLREVVNRTGARAQWCEWEEISPLVIAATLAVEDARFYDHGGVDFLAVARALRQFATTGYPQSGASTITMQLSRLLYGHPHNAWGKIAQVYDALRLERALDKKQILTQYLNRAFYGAGATGIEAASQRYFGKPCMHLSLAEAALLAGLPKAPSDLNPLKNLEGAKKRQRFVLKRMLETGKINLQEFERACWQPLRIRLHSPQLTALHFTDYVLAQSPPPGDVFTTLDRNLQVQIEKLVADHVQTLKTGGLTNAAVIVLDNRDGAILAMAGNADTNDPEYGKVNGTLALRQPGSTLKPFTYALAFEKGFSPASLVADIETHYQGNRGILYNPQNYSKQYHGPVLMKEALGRSLNVPAVRVAEAAGIEDILERLRAAGFASLNKDAQFYGLGLTLGNGEVTLLELAQGYAMFAREGIPCQAQVFAKQLPAGGPTKLNSKKNCRMVGSPSGRVFSKEVCFLITDILSDERLRIRAFGAANPLLLDFPMAIKTGTSSNWRDNWVVGYTKEYTIAVWTGDFSGRAMNRVYGAIGAGPLFHQVANLVVKRGALRCLPSRPQPPDGVEQILVCSLSGKLPGPHCSNYCSVYVLQGTRPEQEVCDMHQLVRIDNRNGLLASDHCPARYLEERVYEILPPIYAQWQAEHQVQMPPTRYSPFCPPGGITTDALVITHPKNGEIYLVEPGYDRTTQTLRFSGEVDPVLPQVSWLVDGQKISSAGWPYDADWALTKGKHTLMMTGRGRSSDSIEFEVR